MIIITGPGRSGTSVVARMYQQLGFDPGGTWFDDVEAGLESADVVDINERIIDLLGMTHLGAPSGFRRRIVRAGKWLIPRPLREPVRTRIASRAPLLSSAAPGMLRWDRFEAVVDRIRPDLEAIAGRHQVVKDPRFCWTLGVWAASGVAIEHVTICVRRLESMVQSRDRARHLRYRSPEAAKNGFVYATGLAVTAVNDYRLPHAIIRFPDFVDSPESLFVALRFPEPTTRAEFDAVFNRVVRPELVHETDERVGHARQPNGSDRGVGPDAGVPQ